MASMTVTEKGVPTQSVMGVRNIVKIPGIGKVSSWSQGNHFQAMRTTWKRLCCYFLVRMVHGLSWSYGYAASRRVAAQRPIGKIEDWIKVSRIRQLSGD